MFKGLVQSLFGVSPNTTASGMFVGTLPGGTGYAPKRGTREFLEIYSQSPWLRAVVDRLAKAVAQVEWQLFVVKKPGQRAERVPDLQRADRVRRKTALQDRMRMGELTPVLEHPFLTLINSANSFHTGMQMRSVTQAHLELVGEAYWLKERNPLGIPVAVWALPPSWVIATPTPSLPAYKVSFRGWRVDIPERDMLAFVDVDPANPYGRGTGIAHALSDELESDEYAAKTTRSWFFNSARPDLIVSAAGLSETQTRKLESDWNARHQGYWQKFKTHFLNADVSIQQLGQDFRSQQFVQLRDFERNIIIHTFGLPPEILGIIENSNRSTIDAASYMFNSKCVVPRLESLRTIMQERLIPEWDDRLILEYMDPVEEDHARQMEAAKAFPAAFMIDEMREWGGKSPLPNGQGRVHLVPWDVAAYTTFTASPRSSGRNDAVGREADALTPEQLASVQRGLEQAGRGDVRSLGSFAEHTETRQMDEGERFIAGVTTDEKRWARGIRRAIEAAGTATAAALRAQAPYGAAAIQGEVAARGRLIRVAEQYLPSTMAAGWRDGLRLLAERSPARMIVRAPFDERVGEIQVYIRTRPVMYADAVVAGLSDRFRTIITEAVAEGVNIEEMARRIESDVNDSFTRSHARKIARTEVVSAQNKARVASWQNDPDAIVQRHTWLTAGDERVREDHVEANGQSRRLGEPFDVGGAALLYPGDPSGPARQIIQCRCTTLPVV